MYEVVGCGDCSALWIREGEAETATCPRCGKRHQVDALRALASAESAEAAREARSALLVARDGDQQDIAGYSELDEEIESAGMPEDAYLTAHGIDIAEVDAAAERATRRPERRSHRAIVRSAITEVDVATEAEILDAAADRGVERDATAEVLRKLVRTGEILRDGEGYRLVE